MITLGPTLCEKCKKSLVKIPPPVSLEFSRSQKSWSDLSKDVRRSSVSLACNSQDAHQSRQTNLLLISGSCVKSVATHDTLTLHRGHTIPEWEQHINLAEPGEIKALCATGKRTQYNQTVKNIYGANINFPSGSWFLLGENIYVANRNYILFPFYCLKHTNKLYFSLMTYYSWIFYFTGIYSSIPNL